MGAARAGRSPNFNEAEGERVDSGQTQKGGEGERVLACSKLNPLRSLNPNRLLAGNNCFERTTDGIVQT